MLSILNKEEEFEDVKETEEVEAKMVELKIMEITKEFTPSRGFQKKGPSS